MFDSSLLSFHFRYGFSLPFTVFRMSTSAFVLLPAHNFYAIYLADFAFADIAFDDFVLADEADVMILGSNCWDYLIIVGLFLHGYSKLALYLLLDLQLWVLGIALTFSRVLICL